MSNPETITRIHAREVLDSRGQPTVEVEVHCQNGAWGRAIVPAGASTGSHEARELRDSALKRYGGKGVARAVANVRERIAPRLLGLLVIDQAVIDSTLCKLDSTTDKSRLGANAILGVSLACAHAAAAVRQIPLWRHLDTEGRACLPLPMINMISGGLHAGGNLDLQDFLLLPIGARSYSEALEMTVAVYRSLGATLTSHHFEGYLVGDEGGFGPRLTSNEQAIEMILEAIGKAGFTPGKDATIALDVASSHFFHENKYELKVGGKSKPLSSDELVDLLTGWVNRYPILSIEDGMAEDDWDGWQKLTVALGKRVQLIGDDLFVTNPERLQRGIQAGVANSILIKPNQIGTLTETLNVIAQARAAGYRPVISARSGETEDTTIADLAVATGAGQIKIGSVARSERLAKYNQLLRIEEQLGPNAPFAGWVPIVS
ncbi:MAG TPA: phosphopyruvate hydratase [Gemmataceae bacterium]|nr:phosphopyruvate hydratase [Gemmataceae bacterium]